MGFFKSLKRFWRKYGSAILTAASFVYTGGGIGGMTSKLSKAFSLSWNAARSAVWLATASVFYSSKAPTGDLNQSETPFMNSTVYNFSGEFKNTESKNAMLPIIYGKHLAAANLFYKTIDPTTSRSNNASTYRLNMATSISEGPILGLANLLVNDTEYTKLGWIENEHFTLFNGHRRQKLANILANGIFTTAAIGRDINYQNLKTPGTNLYTTTINDTIEANKDDYKNIYVSGEFEVGDLGKLTLNFTGPNGCYRLSNENGEIHNNCFRMRIFINWKIDGMDDWAGWKQIDPNLTEQYNPAVQSINWTNPLYWDASKSFLWHQQLFAKNPSTPSMYPFANGEAGRGDLNWADVSNEYGENFANQFTASYTDFFYYGNAQEFQFWYRQSSEPVYFNVPVLTTARKGIYKIAVVNMWDNKYVPFWHRDGGAIIEDTGISGSIPALRLDYVVYSESDDSPTKQLTYPYTSYIAYDFEASKDLNGSFPTVKPVVEGRQIVYPLILDTAINDTDEITTIVCSDASYAELNTSGFNVAVINGEIFNFTGKSGNTLTGVTRSEAYLDLGNERIINISKASHASGDIVWLFSLPSDEETYNYLHYRNPVWQILDLYMNQRYGNRLEESKIDFDNFIEIANYCRTNELWCDIIIDSTQTIEEAINTIYLTFGGMRADNNGKRAIRIDKVWDGTLSYENSGDPIQIFSQSSYNDVSVSTVDDTDFNRLIVQYIDATDNEFKQKQIVFDDEEGIVSSGNRIKPYSMNFFGVTNEAQLKKMAFVFFKKSKLNKYVVTFTTTIKGVKIEKGDVFGVQIPSTGWGYDIDSITGLATPNVDYQLMRCVSVDRDLANGKYTITSNVYDANVYTYDDTFYVTYNEPKSTFLNDRYIPDQITSLNAAYRSAENESGGFNYQLNIAVTPPTDRKGYAGFKAIVVSTFLATSLSDPTISSFGLTQNSFKDGSGNDLESILTNATDVEVRMTYNNHSNPSDPYNNYTIYGRIVEISNGIAYLDSNGFYIVYNDAITKVTPFGGETYELVDMARKVVGIYYSSGNTLFIDNVSPNRQYLISCYSMNKYKDVNTSLPKVAFVNVEVKERPVSKNLIHGSDFGKTSIAVTVNEVKDNVLMTLNQTESTWSLGIKDTLVDQIIIDKSFKDLPTDQFILVTNIVNELGEKIYGVINSTTTTYRQYDTLVISRWIGGGPINANNVVGVTLPVSGWYIADNINRYWMDFSEEKIDIIDGIGVDNTYGMKINVGPRSFAEKVFLNKVLSEQEAFGITDNYSQIRYYSYVDKKSYKSMTVSAYAKASTNSGFIGVGLIYYDENYNYINHETTSFSSKTNFTRISKEFNVSQTNIKYVRPFFYGFDFKIKGIGVSNDNADGKILLVEDWDNYAVGTDSILASEVESLTSVSYTNDIAMAIGSVAPATSFGDFKLLRMDQFSTWSVVKIGDEGFFRKVKEYNGKHYILEQIETDVDIMARIHRTERGNEGWGNFDYTDILVAFTVEDFFIINGNIYVVWNDGSYKYLSATIKSTDSRYEYKIDTNALIQFGTALDFYSMHYVNGLLFFINDDEIWYCNNIKSTASTDWTQLSSTSYGKRFSVVYNNEIYFSKTGASPIHKIEVDWQNDYSNTPVISDTQLTDNIGMNDNTLYGLFIYNGAIRVFHDGSTYSSFNGKDWTLDSSGLTGIATTGDSVLFNQNESYFILDRVMLNPGGIIEYVESTYDQLNTEMLIGSIVQPAIKASTITAPVAPVLVPAPVEYCMGQPGSMVPATLTMGIGDNFWYTDINMKMQYLNVIYTGDYNRYELTTSEGVIIFANKKLGSVFIKPCTLMIADNIASASATIYNPYVYYDSVNGVLACTDDATTIGENDIYVAYVSLPESEENSWNIQLQNILENKLDDDIVTIGNGKFQSFDSGTIEFTTDFDLSYSDAGGGYFRIKPVRIGTTNQHYSPKVFYKDGTIYDLTDSFTILTQVPQTVGIYCFVYNYADDTLTYTLEENFTSSTVGDNEFVLFKVKVFQDDLGLSTWAKTTLLGGDGVYSDFNSTVSSGMRYDDTTISRKLIVNECVGVQNVFNTQAGPFTIDGSNYGYISIPLTSFMSYISSYYKNYEETNGTTAETLKVYLVVSNYGGSGIANLQSYCNRNGSYGVWSTWSGTPIALTQFTFGAYIDISNYVYDMYLNSNATNAIVKINTSDGSTVTEAMINVAFMGRLADTEGNAINMTIFENKNISI